MRLQFPARLSARSIGPALSIPGIAPAPASASQPSVDCRVKDGAKVLRIKQDRVAAC
jgi:hypothetical protein